MLRIRFAQDHPVFAGHFPGAPIVPGVLLLAEALEQLERAAGTTLACTRILSAKFLRPVGPGQLIDVQLRPGDECHSQLLLSSAGEPIAQARLEHAPRAASAEPP